MNKKMEMLLKKTGITLSQFDHKLRTEELRRHISEGVLLVEGAYLNIGPGDTEGISRDGYFDLTAMECSINHVHLDWLIPPGATDEETLIESIAYMLELDSLLQRDYPQVPFRIILSVDWEIPRNCTVRFHKIRLDEVPWLVEDLEKYELDGILILHTNT